MFVELQMVHGDEAFDLRNLHSLVNFDNTLSPFLLKFNAGEDGAIATGT
jgi:hypothetical protein